ncbi:lamin tail domain-containing protein [Glaciibacter psychrotolerans]|uniref:LTD domain-containing protein n=1 Tax=Glaciibacter psychrotolerans TaxID=670054 RepID=A0A7Z0EFY8_9MICO|nr:lamin tail domain-containing protein [Leifsonia psychrotolerans]NYJ20746.1 hypothetical protein [Leifsonia psychrotolerans]
MRKTWRGPATALLTSLAVLVPVAATLSPAMAMADAPSGVRINEVESSGGAPGDWIELVNTASAPADVSGLVLKDNDDTHSFVVPAATTIPAGGFLALDVDVAYGLGAADSARLFTADGVTLIDTYSWTAHATTTYGRCPDGTGEFVTTKTPTKGAANDCVVPDGSTEPGTGGPSALPWPGGTAISAVDAAGFFGTNLSGLAYQPSGTAAPGTIWASKNGVGTMYQLAWNGATWAAVSTDGWASGKPLHYADGTGDVDAEGIALTDAGPAGGVFISSERNNDVSKVSRPSVLRYDVTGSAATLSATIEWNLVADLPPVAPNSGLEAIAWVPDSFLVAQGFVDESSATVYRPADYPNHGTGLFVVGLEANGTVYAYALDQVSGDYHRVATISSGFSGVMDLEFDAERSALWAACDDTCDGRSSLLQVAQTGERAGHFAVTTVYERPSGMPNINNEGFALAPQKLCVDGLKPVFWSDDNNTASHALREGTIACSPTTTDPTDPPTPVDPPAGPAKPVPTASLTDATRGFITAPATAHPGAPIIVAVGAASAGGSVDVWLHSEPVHLARRIVSGAGTVNVTIPASAAAGAHRLAVVAADGTLIGWADITIVAISTPAGTPGSGNGPSGPGISTPGSGTAVAGLASTGIDISTPATALLLLLGCGAGLLLLRRRGATS